MRLVRSIFAPLLLAAGCAPAAAPPESAVVVAATPPPPSLAPSTPPVALPPAIALVHRARCGQCHIRVEPGQRTREALTTALARHRKRVPLSEDQWSALIDYLAAPAGAAHPAG
jgi:hypothetical protein